MKQYDPDMSPRFVEEFNKRNIGPRELVKQLKCPTPVVDNWLYHGVIPGAHYLRKLHNLGYDIIYILTGERHV